MNYLLMILVTIITLETPKFLITAAKEVGIAENELAKEVRSYWEEANYPEDEDLEVIRQDLIRTLDLDDCTVQKK